MNYKFAHIYHIPNADPSKPAREFGVALLSRYPIVAFTNHDITRHSTQDSTAAPAPMPGLLEARVNVGGRLFRVFDVHLDYRSDPTVRTQQVREIREYMGNDTIPTILTGDLNASPDAPELHTLLLNMTDLLEEAGRSEFTYSSSKPEKRIDYILTTQVCPISANVVKAHASDHFPVVADISATKRCIDLRHGIK
jgi:endonuclease/exonuclease/phosphatase family metal-dependent hydrolase